LSSYLFFYFEARLAGKLVERIKNRKAKKILKNRKRKDKKVARNLTEPLVNRNPFELEF
jgi:hypothetical protein